jgi:hypothetical protein
MFGTTNYIVPISAEAEGALAREGALEGERAQASDKPTPSDGNQQASLKDPFHVPVGPITRARSKMIKESISGLIQEIWAGSKTEHSNLGPKEDEGVINLIQALEGANLG